MRQFCCGSSGLCSAVYACSDRLALGAVAQEGKCDKYVMKKVLRIIDYYS